MERIIIAGFYWIRFYILLGRDDYGQSSPPSGHFISVGSGLLHSCGLRDKVKSNVGS